MQTDESKIIKSSYFLPTINLIHTHENDTHSLPNSYYYTQYKLKACSSNCKNSFCKCIHSFIAHTTVIYES